MRRLSTLVSMLLVVMVGVVALGRGVIAQEATPAEMAQHPLVGTWLADTDVDDPESPPELVVASADGGWIEVDADGGVALGRWESTGANTANVTLWALDSGGTFIVRASIEVAADGQSLTASYTVEIVGPDGTASGQYGPGGATATRLAVEPMGEPVGSFEDLFAQFEEATPEGASAGALTVTLVDIAFQPSALSIAADTDVTVSLSNTGALPHNFSIDELGISVDVAPGDTGEVTINAPAGTYEFYCNVPGHADAGMVGTLTVE